MACLSSSGRQSLSMANGARAFNYSNRHISHRFLYHLFGQQKSFSHLSINSSEMYNIANTNNNFNSTLNGNNNCKNENIVSASLSKNIALSYFRLQGRSLHVWFGNQKSAVYATASYSADTKCCTKSSISTLVR